MDARGLEGVADGHGLHRAAGCQVGGAVEYPRAGVGSDAVTRVAGFGGWVHALLGAVNTAGTAVTCYANAGSPTVTPIISGGSATSILASGQTIDGNITTAGGTAKSVVIRITRTL